MTLFSGVKTLLVLGLAAASLTTAAPARAVSGCAVTWTVSNHWDTGGGAQGFQADVSITNLGDPITGWSLGWRFAPGQSVTQMWNATWSGTGEQGVATAAGWNAALATGGRASFGLTGVATGANPAPSAFTLNGTPCTGAPDGAGTPSPITSSTPVPTPTVPPATPTPTPTPTPTVPLATPTPTPTPSTGTPPAAYPNPGLVAGDTGVHDPAVVRAPDGTYILVHTGDNLPIKTSTDRITWRNAGVVWPSGAAWTTGYTLGSKNLWAPDISYHDGKFWLYYSASTFGSQHSAIFLATSTTAAAGSWTNQGLVIESGSTNWNAIDPNLIVTDDGQWWLDFGSFWNGIQMVRLDPTTGRRADNTVSNLARRTTANGAIEGAFIVSARGWYYLYASFDLCCQGASSTYRVMVGRSRNVTGPYLDRNGTAMTNGGGTQVLAGHGSIHGPGHEAVLHDTDSDVLFYHYYAADGASFLGINLIGYDAAGWPYVY